jgi:hypothetical protein
MITNKKLQKVARIFECKICDYRSSNKSNYDKHNLTAKHKMLTNTNKKATNVAKQDFTCICGKEYKFQSSLCFHKKKCSMNKGINEGNIQGINEGNIQGKDQGNIQGINEGNIQGKDQEKEDIQNLVIQLIKNNNEKMDIFINENKELKDIIINQQNQMTEIIPKLGNVTNNLNNTNNNQFNLNFFLNEQCKDAISISQFVESVQVTMENLMTTCHNGLGSGLIKLINDNLNKLSIYERPIHCTDKKRETIYIKNGDTWEKDKDKKGMYDLINKIENKQIKQLGLWTDAHPDFMENDTLSSEYTQLINRCTSSIEACRDKVVKYVCIDNFVKE